MKKVLLLITLACISAPIVAYTHTVFNTTPGKIRVKLDLIGKDVNKTLEPGQEMAIGVGGRLIKGVEARGLSGPMAGKTVKVKARGSKAKGREWYVKYVDFKTLSPGTGGGVNITLGSGQQVTLEPGTGRLDIEQR